MTAQRRDRAIVDLLAMVAFYHVTHALDHWHCNANRGSVAARLSL